jgi:hypothetical protein
MVSVSGSGASTGAGACAASGGAVQAPSSNAPRRARWRLIARAVSCPGSMRLDPARQPFAAAPSVCRWARKLSISSSTTPTLMALSATLNDGQGLNIANGKNGR